MSDKNYVNLWITKAMEDFKTAEYILKLPAEEIITSSVCFHSQQAVEKLLKAYLINNDIEVGKTHDLEYILELCKKVDSEFDNIELGNLSSYAVEVRYPDDFYIPSVGEARESFKIAKYVKEFVLRKININDKDLS